MSTGDRSTKIERYRTKARRKKFIFNFLYSFIIVFFLLILFLLTLFGIPNDLYALELNEMKLTSIENMSNSSTDEIKLFGIIESEHDKVIAGYNTGNGFLVMLTISF